MSTEIRHVIISTAITHFQHRLLWLWIGALIWLLCLWLAERQSDWRIALFGLVAFGAGLLQWSIGPSGL